MVLSGILGVMANAQIDPDNGDPVSEDRLMIFFEQAQTEKSSSQKNIWTADFRQHQPQESSSDSEEEENKSSSTSTSKAGSCRIPVKRPDYANKPQTLLYINTSYYWYYGTTTVIQILINDTSKYWILRLFSSHESLSHLTQSPPIQITKPKPKHTHTHRLIYPFPLRLCLMLQRCM